MKKIEAEVSLYGELMQEFKIEDEEKLWGILQKYKIKRLDGYESIDNCIDKFIRSKKCEGLSKASIENYTIGLRTFGRYTGDICPANMGADNIRNYMMHLSEERGLKTSSVAQNIAIVRTFFSWLKKESLILEDPTLMVKMPKYNKNTRHGLTNEEYNSIINNIKGDKEKAILSFFINTGCRVSEVSNLKLENINFEEKTAVVTGKGNKTRIVYFNDSTKENLNTYLDKREGECEYLFSKSKYPFDKMNKAGLGSVIKEMGNRVGVNLYPHKLRHTFATNALNKGMDITVIQHLLGHSDLGTTQIYAELNNDIVKQEYIKIFN